MGLKNDGRAAAAAAAAAASEAESTGAFWRGAEGTEDTGTVGGIVGIRDMVGQKKAGAGCDEGGGVTEEPGVRAVAAAVEVDKAEAGLILVATAMLSGEPLLVCVMAVLLVVSVVPRFVSELRLDKGF